MLKSYDNGFGDNRAVNELNKSLFYRCSYLLLLVTVFINIAFPKAGIKLGGIPLTVGNVFLMLNIFMWLIAVLWRRCFVFSKAETLVIFSCIYWAVRFLLVMTGGRIGLGDWVGFFVPLVIYPFTFIVFNYFITEKNQLDFIMKMLLAASIIIFVFGFLQAIFGIDKFSIPGLTVNYTDYISSDNWYAEKYNGVQEDVTYAKTVSTYQNGNLLGVNIILFCPLIYESIKNKSLRHVYLLVFTMFCVLTGSKTCWVGIFIYLFIKAVPVINKKWEKRNNVFICCLGLLIIPIILGIYFSMFPQVIERFKDSFTLENIDDLSGRSDAMNGLINYFLNKTEWIITGPYGLTDYWGSSYEMTYFCILMLGGICGIIAFLAPILYVIISKMWNFRKKSPVIKGVIDGVLVYLVIAIVEGALWLPPTAINLWIVVGFGYKYCEYLKQEKSACE